LKLALERRGTGGAAIKGTVSSQPDEGLVPGFSASGQDVWLPKATFSGPGIVLSAVGARCGRCFAASGSWGVVANTAVFLPSRNYAHRYLWYVANLDGVWIRGGSAQPYVLVPESLAQRWPFPPFNEQTQIARFLDYETAKIDRLIEKQQKLIALLKEKRQAVISHAVTKGLNPDAPMKDSGVEWLGKVPAHWEVSQLGYLTPEVTVGIVVTPSKYYVESGVPCLRSLNVRPGHIRTEELVYVSATSNDLHSKSKIFEGDVVIVRTGQPGTAARVTNAFDGCNCIDLLIVRQTPRLRTEFLVYLLNSESTSIQIAAGSGGAIQQHFNVGSAKKLRVLVPPVSEQEEIAESLRRRVKGLDELTSRAETQELLLLERRTALISAAVTGKIDVRGWKPPKGDDEREVA
jgi:type I restriction enzyme S subunit